MSKHICRMTGLQFELPAWTDGFPAVGEYAAVHKGFREACLLVPPKSQSMGASYLRSRLKRAAAFELERRRKELADAPDLSYGRDLCL